MLDGIRKILSNDKPVGSNSLFIGIQSGRTDVVIVQYPPKIENPRSARRKRRLRE